MKTRERGEEIIESTSLKSTRNVPAHLGSVFPADATPEGNASGWWHACVWHQPVLTCQRMTHPGDVTVDDLLRGSHAGLWTHCKRFHTWPCDHLLVRPAPSTDQHQQVFMPRGKACREGVGSSCFPLTDFRCPPPHLPVLDWLWRERHMLPTVQLAPATIGPRNYSQIRTSLSHTEQGSRQDVEGCDGWENMFHNRLTYASMLSPKIVSTRTMSAFTFFSPLHSFSYFPFKSILWQDSPTGKVGAQSCVSWPSRCYLYNNHALTLSAPHISHQKVLDTRGRPNCSALVPLNKTFFSIISNEWIKSSVNIQSVFAPSRHAVDAMKERKRKGHREREMEHKYIRTVWFISNISYSHPLL